jgi:CubicO group peptidase (beta-lactamase class C family)
MLSKQICTLSLLGPLLHSAANAQSIWPLRGPIFPSSRSLSSSEALQSAIANLTQPLQQTISNGKASYGPFDPTNASYSVELFSTLESTLFTNQFTTPTLVTAKYGVKSVDSNTVFRIGSLTKLFTVCTFLIEAWDAKFNDPVTKYVPRLLEAAEAMNDTEGSLDYEAWDEITLAELASQMADIGRNYEGVGEIGGPFYPVADPLELGLPPLNASKIPCVQGDPSVREPNFSLVLSKAILLTHPLLLLSTPM